MPTAFYALSYQDIGSILAYCVLEKQTFANQAAVDALRDRLIPNGLSLSLVTSTGSPLVIPKSDVSVDEVTVDPQDVASFTSQPYLYNLVLPLGGSPKAGDGKLKKLRRGDGITLSLTHTATADTVTAAMGSNAPEPRPFYAFVAGQGPVSATLVTNTPSGSAIVTTPPIAAGTIYPVVVIGHNLATTLALVKAT